MKELVGRRIRYLKANSRLGWMGRIITYNKNMYHIVILFDNGTRQTYKKNALLFNNDSSPVHAEQQSEYILVLEDETKEEINQEVQALPGNRGDVILFTENSLSNPNSLGKFSAPKVVGVFFDKLGQLHQVQQGSRYHRRILDYKELHSSPVVMKEKLTPEPRKHGHYFKDVSELTEVDVYMVCELFGIDDPSGCTQHAIKKLLLPGNRGGGKTTARDIQEAIDTLIRFQEISKLRK